MAQLEFWADYEVVPLRTEDGKAVDLVGLGLPDGPVERLIVWNGQYARHLPTFAGPARRTEP